MMATMGHRGPDGDGIHVAPGIGLGHRRLAIIDPATGHQPRVDAGTGNVIVYNGGVYNYVEIRSELESRGYHHGARRRCRLAKAAQFQRDRRGWMRRPTHCAARM